MDTRHLQTFLTAAQEQSFNRAARALHLTQPTVSQRVRALEDELGVRLFSRTRHRVILTPEGRALLPVARQMLQLEAQAYDRLHAVREELAGEFSVGATVVWSMFVLPQLFTAFQRRYPRVRFDVFTGPTALVAQRLLQYEAVLGLLGEPVRHADLEEIPWLTVPVGVLARPSHPLARRRPLYLREVLAMPVATYVRTPSGLWRQIEACYRQVGMTPQTVIYISQTAAVLEIVASSNCLAFLPVLYAQSSTGGTPFTVLEIADLPPMALQLAIAYPKGYASHPFIVFAKTELERIREHLRQRLSAI